MFAGIAAFSLGVAHLESDDAVAKLQANLVSANYFGVLGVRPLLGRTFVPNEGQVDGAEPVAVISKSLWRRHFSSDPTIVGRTIRLNGRLVTVVGVVPAFRADMFAFSPDVWVPLSAYELVTPGLLTGGQRTETARSVLANRQRGWLRWVARLKPGVSLAQAQAGTEVLARQIKQAYPDSSLERPETAGVAAGGAGMMQTHPDSSLQRGNFTLTATDLPTQLWRPMAGALPLGIMLLLLSLSVLVIASGNLANLLLARAEARRHEMAVRLAMGARRLRLIRQLLVESGLLGLAGGIGGVVWAYWSGVLLANFISGLTAQTFIPVRPSITVDRGALAFALVVALLTGLVFGLAPALHASKIELLPALQGSSQAPVVVKRRWSWRSLSIVVQVAFCFVLLTAAGLFARSLQRAHSADLGFDPDNVLRIPIDLTRRSWPEAQMKQHLGQMVERVQHVPDIQSVTLTEHSPDTGGVSSFSCRTTNAMSTQIQVLGNIIGPDYFRTMKVPLVRGRDFAAEDERGVPVVIVNETLARHLWPEENPIGKRLGLFNTGRGTESWTEVIGVAHDAKYLTIEEPQRLYLYVPYCQQPRSSMTLLIRVKKDWPEAIPRLRRELLAMDTELPVYDLKPLTDGLAVWFIVPRLLASMVGTLGVLGLLLATLGLYGVVAYQVSRRTREIGIRMALGAERRSVIRLVMRQGLFLVLVGTGIGLGVAVLTTRLIARLLFGISPLDPVAFIGVAVLMTGVAALACYLPARRATQFDPMVALRYE